MKKITLIGATGLVGTAIKLRAQENGVAVYEPRREDREFVLSSTHDHIVYCAGENNCAAGDEDNIVDANSFYIAELVARQNFEHLTYFSSTRIYGESSKTDENDIIEFDFRDPRAAFNASKLSAEAICQRSKKPVLILRPSNIYGLSKTSKLFLPSITRDAVVKKHVNMFVPKNYSKDYINVSDVAFFSFDLSSRKEVGVFNLASGQNVSAETIANILEAETECAISWRPFSKVENFKPISASKIKKRYPSHIISKLEVDLVQLVRSFRETL